jgi:hypothetical protein
MTKRFICATACTLLATLLLAGCQLTEAPDSVSPADSATSVSDILNRELPPEITAYGVVLAALYIATGDAEEGIASGRITPAEVYEAKQAIEDGTLDLWRQRAESEIKGLND